MMNRNHDPIVKATVIIVACIVATIMICVECALRHDTGGCGSSCWA